MIDIEARVVGLDAVRADLFRLLDQLGDKAVDQFLRRAGALAKARIRSTFRKGGPGWAPIKASTWERRKYLSTKSAKRDLSSKWSTHEKRAYERMLYGGLTAREAKKAGTFFEPPQGWETIDLKFGRARASDVPLGGAEGTFAKAIRVKRLGGQQVYIGPPWRGGGKKDLYDLWKIHAEGSGRLPARRMDYLEPGDEDRIVHIAEDIVDKALKITSGSKGGRISEFFRTDLTGK